MSVRRRLGAAFAATASTAAIAGFPTTAFAAEPGPTATARHQGITARGQAFMGWNQSAEPAAGGPADRAALTTPFASGSGVEGVDVSSYQRTVGWSGLYQRGVRFAYVKATEGRTYRNPYFHTQYLGAYRAGMSHGAYHFAIPNISGGSTQASYFVAHGGGWTADGRTLPGVLDIEYNPYGSTCYGLSRTRMVSWIRSFTTPLPPAHRPRRGDLHDVGVVAPVHRQLHRVPPDQPAVGGHEQWSGRHAPGRLAVPDVLAVRRDRRPGP